MTTIHIDKNVGISGEKIHWMRSKDGKEFWCRQPIAIFGSFNMSNEYIENTSPFEKDYQENFIEGKGKTKEEALMKMQAEIEETSNSLWAI